MRSSGIAHTCDVDGVPKLPNAFVPPNAGAALVDPNMLGAVVVAAPKAEPPNKLGLAGCPKPPNELGAVFVPKEKVGAEDAAG